MIELGYDKHFFRVVVPHWFKIVHNGISSWTTSLASTSPQPETQADDLGMLLQTESHYPKTLQKKKKKNNSYALIQVAGLAAWRPYPPYCFSRASPNIG
jgi:hypothetical protein